MVANRAKEKGLVLRRDSDGQLPPVLLGDVGRIRQVLLNLLSNAVKFTAQGEIRMVTRCLARDQKSARIEWRVEDTGMGIAPEALGKLFANFVQGDSSINRRFGGTGLGLATCKRIVEQMGGDLGVESTLGAGSRFCVRLSLPWADALKLDQPADGQAATVLRDRIAALGRPLRILIAEDNTTNQLVARQMLKEFDVTPWVVGDGVEAIAAVQNLDFDLIFMDVHMPEVDGLAATRAIRALGGAHAVVPIIAVTANAFPDDIRICRIAGMNGFVAKPVRKQALIEAMIDALDSRVLQRQRGMFPALAASQLKAGGSDPDGLLESLAKNGEVIDVEQLDLLADEIGLDAACLAMGVFIDETGARLARLRAMSVTDARGTIRSEAHTLKGAAATLGAVEISTLARRLEFVAAEMSAEDYSAALDRLSLAFDRAKQHLPGEFAKAAA